MCARPGPSTSTVLKSWSSTDIYGMNTVPVSMNTKAFSLVTKALNLASLEVLSWEQGKNKLQWRNYY